MDLEQRKNLIKYHEDARNSHAESINRLKKTCPHHFHPLTNEEILDEWMSVPAYCTVCSTNFGWRCKCSPDGICHYMDDDEEEVILIDGRIVKVAEKVENCSIDCCVYCGMPDERK